MKKIGKSRYLLISSAALLFGIFAASFLGYNNLIMVLALIFLLILLISFWKDLQIRLMVIAGLFFLFGIFYSHFYEMRHPDQLSSWQNQTVQIQGQIVKTPDIKSDQQQFVILTYRIHPENQKDFQNAQGKILIKLRRFPEYQQGQWLEISGEILKPKSSSEFDYGQYLAKSEIYSLMSYPKITEIEKPVDLKQNFVASSWQALLSALSKAKQNFSQKINLILPEPESSFLAGLLIGAKNSIPENLMSAFNLTGTTHIVVISGFNITIIIKVFMSLTKRWSKKLSIITAVLGVFLFTVMVGAEPPVVRAAVMAMFIIWAERLGRKSDISLALIITALLMVLINPRIIRADLGFQLSFMAVAGLIWFVPILENYFSRWRLYPKIPKIITEPLLATLSAQILTTPLILFNFHRISVVAPIVNVLILPIIPLAMLLGFLAVMSSFIFISFSQVVGWFSWLVLKYIILVVTNFAKIPFASLEQITISSPILFSWYLLMAVFLIWYYQKDKKIIKLQKKLNAKNI
ncbi:MAG TPA: ComEC/Rec2 family competence protein [Patescibacteria group bacterium]|nr:ComEC/Rec2 family competence protein [Patescibacteria group bacterium]